MEEFSSKDMDHLGLVASMCDEIGIVKIINQLIPPDSRATVSAGECAKLMIINGLGFSARPLYLEAQFFSSKPIKRFLGRDLLAEKISDDCLGRALDHFYEGNCERIFSIIASKAVTYFNVNVRFRHLDTTSMSVHGKYEEEMGLVEFGYSKDNNPDLKQFMISLMSSQDGDIPLLAQTIPGNTSDKKHFREILKELKKQIKESETTTYYVADSALYTKETVSEISMFTKWITRVPENITASKYLITNISKEAMSSCGNGYYTSEVCSYYGDVKQRWLVVFSEKAFEKEIKTLEKRITKAEKTLKKQLKKLCSEEYLCEADALRGLKSFERTLKYHTCSVANVESTIKMKKPGRPKKGDSGKTVYRLTCALEKDQRKINKILKAKGKFIIATNELDSNKLSVLDLISNYKNQQSVERGFRFLKDPMFMASSVFLKKQQRIVALGLIMCLCLLVYTLTQRKLRMKLKQMNETLPDQKGKETSKPTIRWIYQIFEGVHVLYRRTDQGINEIVLNLNAIRNQVLKLMGPTYQKIYENVA